MTPEMVQASEAVLEVYAMEPERALRIIDSVEEAGILPDFRADMLRAKVYAWTCDDMRLDSAILIGERLMFHDSVKANTYFQEDVLETLLSSCRLKRDDEQALKWATQLGELYRQRNDEVEVLRNDAEIGVFLVHIGQHEEGLAHIDSVIHKLDCPTTFNQLDAAIIALRRKADVLNELELYGDMIPVDQRILDLLDDYEQHPDDFHDGSIREPSEDYRSDYIDFYRGKAYLQLAVAYASLEFGNKSIEKAEAQGKAREYLALCEQTSACQGVKGRFMITSTLRKLGEYDRMLTIYDEVEQQLGTDTLNVNFAEILLGRAEAAEAQGFYAEANGYRKRHTSLNELLTENLLQSKAHLYAARYHAQEQQIEIERQVLKNRLKSRIIISMLVALLLVILFSIYTIIQKRKMAKKNAAMVKLIDEKEEQSQLLLKPEKDPNDDLALFQQMDSRIRTERLYADQGMQRDELAEILGINRQAINQLLNKYAGGISIPAYLNDIRLSEACRMLREDSETTVAAIADQVGLTLRNLQRLFREQYGMTPTEYRSSHNK